MRINRILNSAAALAVAAAAYAAVDSGLAVGASTPAFEPVHVWGPDKGTETCPVCKYGATPAVQVWVNSDTMENAGAIARSLEAAIQKYGGSKLKVFVIYMNPSHKEESAVAQTLATWAQSNKLNSVAVTYINGPTDRATAGRYKINADAQVKNTILVYKDRTVTAKFVNLTSGKSDIAKLQAEVAAVAAK